MIFNLSSVKKAEKYSCVEYNTTGSEDNKLYKSYLIIYRNDNKLWLLEFSTFDEKFEEKKPDFEKWAESVVISE